MTNDSEALEPHIVPEGGQPTDAAHEPHICVERGQPTDEELAALVSVLGSAAGGAAEPGPLERNLWGHPVDKLRYAIFSWQRVTLLERTHMRR